MRKIGIVLLLTCCFISGYAQNKWVVSGFIKDAASKELLIGATIAVPKYKTGTTTNAYGFFSITLPADTFDLLISYVGYAPKAYHITLIADQELNIELTEGNQLKEAVVTSEKVNQRLAEQTRM
ncbi:MAG: carboxypeptidase-like regulatory domain-containing protein, partial [Bacteroidetes bacterium]